MLMVAKGLVIAPMVGIVYDILYAILSITQRYYGETIIYFALMLPLHIFTIIQWIRNKNNANESVVKVGKLKSQEVIILPLVTIVITIAFYFLLKVLNTNELIISTLSTTTSVLASYLMLRRCSYYAVVFFINDIIAIAMWTISTINSGYEYLPTVILFVMFLVSDVYGFIHWKKEAKNQQVKDVQESSQNFV